MTSFTHDELMAAMKSEEMRRLYIKLAAETLRADQGWQRYELANRAHQVTLAQLEQANIALAAAKH